MFSFRDVTISPGGDDISMTNFTFMNNSEVFELREGKIEDVVNDDLDILDTSDGFLLVKLSFDDFNDQKSYKVDLDKCCNAFQEKFLVHGSRCHFRII